MKFPVSLRDDLPVFATIGIFHPSGSMASLIHWALPGSIWAAGRTVETKEAFVFGSQAPCRPERRLSALCEAAVEGRKDK